LIGSVDIGNVRFAAGEVLASSSDSEVVSANTSVYSNDLSFLGDYQVNYPFKISDFNSSNSGNEIISWNVTGIIQTVELYSEFSVVPTYSDSPSLDVGVDSDTQWSYSGAFSTSQTTPDFASEIQSFLSLCDCPGCTINGTDCIITLEIQSGSAGILQLSSLSVGYSLS
jgi:hypothetical protein